MRSIFTTLLVLIFSCAVHAQAKNKAVISVDGLETHVVEGHSAASEDVVELPQGEPARNASFISRYPKSDASTQGVLLMEASSSNYAKLLLLLIIAGLGVVSLRKFVIANRKEQ